jgi:2-hydroxychromene-2-carboxylate isomerase
MSAPEIDADIHFYWDPVCPFAWMTSRWVRQVMAQRDHTVDWRFISLRIINQHVDYDSHFPPEYEHGHTAGLRMLRVAAAVRAEHGRAAMGPLYAAMGASVFDVDPPDRGGPDRLRLGTAEHVADLLGDVGLPTTFVDALDDATWDAELEAETDEALASTGKDVGTPIISFRPPDGPSFFGPVISRLPSDDDAVALWDSVVHLATFPGFAELKRSLRELPQLQALGVSEDEVGVEQDWHGGSRRQKK